MPGPGQQEKNAAALNSVLAALALMTLKFVVGWLSGSLGILAEAAHSGLDFAAAIVGSGYSQVSVVVVVATG